MEYIGKYGEHATMVELLRRDVEAYLAIKSNQADYDITVILDGKHVVRVQVKSTELQNLNTNNSVDGTEKEFDYLVLVVVDEQSTMFFILSKQEADLCRGSDKKLGVSRKENGRWVVKECFHSYESQWDKILVPPKI